MYVKMTSTSLLLFMLIVPTVTTFSTAQTIHCTRNRNYLKFEVANFTVSIVNTELTLSPLDNFKFYTKNASYTEIFVQRLHATIVGDMLVTHWTPPVTYFRPSERVEYNYELHGFISKVPHNSTSCEFDTIRIVAVPLPTDKTFGVVELLTNQTQMDVEVCVERHLRDKLRHQILPRGVACSPGGSYYVSHLRRFFQNVVNKIADVVVHVVKKLLLNPIQGKIVAPDLSINFTKLLVSGTFSVFNGTLSDLRTIRRRFNVTASFDRDLLTLSGSFHIKTVKVSYNNYNITGVPLLSGGHNVTITFKNGVIADVIVRVNIRNLPCGIALHQLRLTSDGEVSIVANDAFNVVESTIKSEFERQRDAILQQFGDKLRKYIESLRNAYVCNGRRFLDFLEKSLNRTN